jgi:YegS/Rv2252/BmrU family lipid kinase
LLLLNKMARNGGAPIDAALEVLTAGGLDVEEESCDRASALTRTIRERRHDVDCVIVGGGDGTLNCAARAVLETGLPLGILPLGTANDLARTLAIGSDIAVAAQVIADGHLRAIDIGEVNDRLFFNVASIGLAAELARDLTYDVKQRWGRIGYALTTARLLARLRPFTAFLEHDGRIEKVKTVQLAVGNGRHYGGGMTIEQDAVPDDGLFQRLQHRGSAMVAADRSAPILARGNPGKLERRPCVQSVQADGPDPAPTPDQHGW